MEEFLNIHRALSDKTRLRIMWLLVKTKSELCVCEIMDSINESQYNVSRHIKVLKNAGLVKEKKEGRWVLYSIIGPKNKFLSFIFKAIASLPREYFTMDNRRLIARLSLRKNGKCVIGMRSK